MNKLEPTQQERPADTKFIDTEERKTIFSKLAPTMSEEEFTALIENYYPDWIVCALKGYSPDYPHLNSNWHTLCSEHLHTQPRKIILVSDISFDESHVIINTISEFLTRQGYMVRRAGEFVACPVCESAIPCREVWEKIKSLNFPCPREWSCRCSGCGENITPPTA